MSEKEINIKGRWMDVGKKSDNDTELRRFLPRCRSEIVAGAAEDG